MTRDFIKLQHETIEKVTKLLKSYKSAEAVFISGSHSNGEESSFSDIDMCVILSDSEKSERPEIFSKVANLYPSLCALWLFDKNGLFLYQNGVRLDLDFLIQEELENWDLTKVKIVYDIYGKYQNNPKKVDNQNSLIEPIWRDKEGDILDWFFWMFRQVYCWIRRGTTDSKRSFRKLYFAQDSLKTIRDKLIEIEEHPNPKWNHLKKIDKDIAGKLALTFTDMNPNNMVKATRDLLDIYEIVGKKYCIQEGKEFPQDKVAIMRKLFDDFDMVVK